ncbi:histidine kinase [Streptomyces sp. MP131-18]|uniref:sensor histidine kinase n=1 Tax=Streptomyces sp. MP131-18 TaxID=1857892 RepID=UPI0009A1F901|nr:histidine kinase [Streptomyces sp. MP131-18]ONK14405.1 Sensor histidine kinase DesK [Streptomyces sp. MP131-18]
MVNERRERRGAALPPWAVDALLGAAVCLVLSLVISADQGGRHGPDAPAYLWAAGLGALMLARRRHPGIVLAVTALGLFAYYAAGYPAVGVAVPVAAALFSAAEFGRLALAVATTAAVLAVSLFFRLLEGQDFSFVVGYELAGHVLLMAAAIALGDSLRSRRSVQAGARRIADLAAERSRQDADARLHAERLAIARELHDSIGHTTSVISLHADVARESLGRDEAQTRAALGLIKSATTHTMTELRRTVALLRAPGEGGRTVVSLSNVESLRASASAAGVDVDLHVDLDGARDGLPATVNASAFRIVQEAVTNIVRHSRGSRARISVRADGDVLRLTVSDDGPPGPGGPAGAAGRGHGIAGMRERAEALGGTLTAGPEDAGFVVRAVLPLERPAGRPA